jgi:hypothetical protein
MNAHHDAHVTTKDIPITTMLTKPTTTASSVKSTKSDHDADVDDDVDEEDEMDDEEEQEDEEAKVEEKVVKVLPKVERPTNFGSDKLVQAEKAKTWTRKTNV